MRVVRKALFAATFSSFLLAAPFAYAEAPGASPGASSEPAGGLAAPRETAPETSAPVAAENTAPASPAAAAPVPSAAAPSSATPAEPVTPAPAYATPQEAAQAAYTEGETLYRAGRFPEAEAAFIRAYRAVPTPTTLIAIAESRAHQGFGPEAVDVFERYLRVAPNAPDAEAVRHRIEALRASPGILRIATIPEGARVSVDGVANEHLTPTDVEVAPGSHQIRVELEGYEPMEGTVEVRFASVRPVNATLEALPPPEPPAPEPVAAPEPEPVRVERRMTKPVWATAAGAGVFAVSGAVLGFTAMKAQGEFDRHPTDAIATRGERMALAADVCFGVAAASAVTSIILFFRQDTDAPPRVSVTPVVTPSSASVQAGMRF